MRSPSGDRKIGGPFGPPFFSSLKGLCRGDHEFSLVDFELDLLGSEGVGGFNVLGFEDKRRAAEFAGRAGIFVVDLKEHGFLRLVEGGAILAGVYAERKL